MNPRGLLTVTVPVLALACSLPADSPGSGPGSGAGSAAEDASSGETGTPRNAEQLVASLSAPGRSLGVESAGSNDSLSVLGPALFPEVRELIALGAGAAGPVLATLSDTRLDGTEDGDRVRALGAFVLETVGAASAVPALRDYLRRALALPDPPFFSLQAGAHALAVLSGQPGRTRSLYGLDEVQSMIASGTRAGALSVTTAKGREIEHRHLIGPKVPPAQWTEDFPPGLVQARNEVFTDKLDGIAQFEDPIRLIADATRSYDCHSWTFRQADTRLSDLAARYHILSESVETILADEGYSDVTSKPDQWHVDDVVVFYKTAGGTPTHTGRLSAVGTSLDDPALRFTSKWSVTLPVVDVSVRDCSKLYGKVVRIHTATPPVKPPPTCPPCGDPCPQPGFPDRRCETSEACNGDQCEILCCFPTETDCTNRTGVDHAIIRVGEGESIFCGCEDGYNAVRDSCCSKLLRCDPK